MHKAAIAGLIAVIVACGGIIGAKAARNGFFFARMQWEDMALRFHGAPVDREKLAKYGEHVPREKVREPCSAKVTYRITMANPDNATKVTGANTVSGIGYSFTLAVEHLDDLLLGVAWSDPAAGSSVSANGASIGWTQSAEVLNDGYNNFPAPAGWPGAAQTAWNEWIAELPPYPNPPGVWGAVTGFLFIASAQAGQNSDSMYKCFGWATDQYVEPTILWVGDTEWVLAGSYRVNNLEMRLIVDDLTSSKWIYPRRWSHREASYYLYTMVDETPTTITVTLGDLSATDTVDLSPDENGKVDPSVATALTWLGCGLSVVNTASYDLSYSEVRDVASYMGAVPINMTCSLWSTQTSPSGAGDWTAQWEPLENAQWHCFNSGNTLKLHRITGAGGTGAISTLTYALGPVRWNVQAGRFGDRNENFGLPGDFKVDVGLFQWTSETETEEILLSPGLSDWYVFSETGTGWGIGVLHTGLHNWGTGLQVVTPVVDEDWLTDNNELLEYEGTSTLDNRRASIALASVQHDPATDEPEWGPAIDLVWTEISADIPPGYEDRPTEWVAGAGASIDADWWTLDPGGGTITRTLASRHDARLAYLESGWFTGEPAYDPDWPIIAEANHELASDPPVVAAVCEVEDVTNYDNSRLLALSFSWDEEHPHPGEIDWTQATLTLDYALHSLTDQWYTPPNHDPSYRFGRDGDFEVTTTEHDFIFAGFGDPEGSVCYFDLAELVRSNTVDLRHVRAISLALPGGYMAHFEDWRLVADPDDHGAGEGNYPRWVPQPATDPWNWIQCACGFGSTYEGMPHLNLNNGSEGVFSGDVQHGIYGTQYWQWNPAWLAEQEQPPTHDPTTARTLQRLVAILGLQEQFAAAVLNQTNVDAATSDDEGNWLGWLYYWDLDRPTGDDTSGEAAMRVGRINAFGAGAPLVPTTMNIRWSTHGRAQGMAYQSGEFVRGAAVSSDDTAAGQALFYRRPVDEEGAPTGPWEVVGSFSPGWTGRWQSPPAKEGGYIYGVRSTATSSSPDSSGVFVTREYQYLLAWIPSGSKICPCAWCEPVSGICHVVYVQGGDVYYTQSDPWTQQGNFRGWRYGALNPIKGTTQAIGVFTGGYTDPAVVVMPTREIIASARAATSPYGITLKRSLDQGATWEDIA